MSVYFIEKDNLVKIGFSNDLKNRVAEVCREFGPGCGYLGFMPGGRDLERHLHRRFADRHRHGEWFERSEALNNFIDTAARSGFPGDETASPQDRLEAQEERYADEASEFIQNALIDLPPDSHADAFREISKVTTIDVNRLEAIHSGAVCPVTAGEYAVLRAVQDAFDEGGVDISKNQGG